MNKFRIMLPARDIPADATVTKPGGHTVYRLVNHVRIYLPSKEVRDVRADPGTRFLLSESAPGHITAIAEDKELCWVTDRPSLERYWGACDEASAQ